MRGRDRWRLSQKGFDQQKFIVKRWGVSKEMPLEKKRIEEAWKITSKEDRKQDN